MSSKKEQTTTAMPVSQKVPFGERIAFGLGDLAANLFVQYIAVFLVVFYTDTLGIPSVIAGFIVLFSRIFDGVNDMAIAYIADKFGNYRKWVLGFALLASLLFFTMFLNPSGLGVTGKVVYAVLTFSLWTIIHTCYNVPYNAMSSTVTADPHERTKLTSIRFMVIVPPVACVSIFTPIIIKHVTPALGASFGYPIAALVWSVIGFIGVWIFAKTVKERVVIHRSPQQKVGLKETVRLVVTNEALIIQVGFFLFSNLRHNLNYAVLPYFFNYYLGNYSLLSIFSLINIPFSLAAIYVSSYVIKKMGKRNAGIFYSVVCIALFVCRFLFKQNIAAQLVIFLLYSIPSGGLTIVGFSMIADTVDYGIKKTGNETIRAVNYSVALFFQKLSMGLSATVLGVALAAFGYVANAGQSAESMRGILMCASIFLAVITLIGMLILCFWKYDSTGTENNA